ncbi:unnamed protein product, partial [Rotaria sp. Silwood1]
MRCSTEFWSFNLCLILGPTTTTTTTTT